MNTLFTWHTLQSTLVCAPVSGNVVWVVWLNVAPLQFVVLWQVSQVCGKAAEVWLGSVVPCQSFRWQEMQVVARPANTLFTWQVAQATFTCAPVSGNLVVLWLNVAPFQFVVLWQREQSCGNPAVTWFGLLVPVKSAW